MIKALTALAFLAMASANLRDRDFYESKFVDYIKEHKMDFDFSGHEFLHRVKVFADNFDLIEQHNKGTHTYKMALNQYAHMSWSEFREHFALGGTRLPNLRANQGKTFTRPTTTTPSSVDWVSAGAVTGVKDQGNCGSCWSFATTGSIEGAYEIKYGSLNSYSEQNLVDCDRVDSGCNGGWMDRAYGFMKRNGGICTEADYPYTSGTTGKAGECQTTCTKDAKSAPVDWTDVTPEDVGAMEGAVAQQPVAVAIAVNTEFQFYSSGVFSGTCGDDINHGVLTVGYGTDGSQDFWNVKNSWGTGWGEGGYVRIAKGDDNLCHILDAPVFPTL